jgi:hypothetical protein
MLPPFAEDAEGGAFNTEEVFWLSRALPPTTNIAMAIIAVMASANNRAGKAFMNLFSITGKIHLFDSK